MSQQKIDILKKALQREKLARKAAEKILEEKSLELYKTNQNLSKVLNEKQIQLDSLFETIVDPYILMDMFGNVIKMNDASVDFFGYDIEKESFNVLSTLHKDDFDYAMKSFKKLVSNGVFKNFKARVFNKKRELKWVEINSSLVYDESKKPTFAQGIVRDITNQIIQQQIFEEQKEQLNQIVEHSSLGIVLTQNGEILKTNKAFQKFLGYTSLELEKLQVKDISIKEDYPESLAKMEGLNSGKIDFFSIKKRYIRKDKSIFWAQTNVSAVRDENKNIKYQVALIEDITDKLAIEREKEEILSNLKRSNKELKDFAHIVSHDLKAPLRSMNALVTWLQEDCEPFSNNAIEENFQHLIKKIDKMDHLINGILKYASIDKGQYKKQKIDLSNLVNEIIDSIYIPDYISVKILDKLPTIKGDQFRLHQLFQNLISNAVKYADKKNGIVTISSKKNKSKYQFSIEDNGCGIEEKYHRKIFEIFQTLDDNQSSTGVGLSIVKKILDMYGGDIFLESEKNVGTKFIFTLPY